MKNIKIVIEQKLISLGFTLGCYDSQIEKLSKPNLAKILDNVEYVVPM